MKKQKIIEILKKFPTSIQRDFKHQPEFKKIVNYLADEIIEALEQEIEKAFDKAFLDYDKIAHLGGEEINVREKLKEDFLKELKLK